MYVDSFMKNRLIPTTMIASLPLGNQDNTEDESTNQGTLS
jgi:hypothetical protein